MALLTPTGVISKSVEEDMNFLIGHDLSAGYYSNLMIFGCSSNSNSENFITMVDSEWG